LFAAGERNSSQSRDWELILFLAVFAVAAAAAAAVAFELAADVADEVADGPEDEGGDEDVDQVFHRDTSSKRRFIGTAPIEVQTFSCGISIIEQREASSKILFGSFSYKKKNASFGTFLLKKSTLLFAYFFF
jgi:hypothetical protein